MIIGFSHESIMPAGRLKSKCKGKEMPKDSQFLLHHKYMTSADFLTILVASCPQMCNERQRLDVSNLCFGHHA